MYSVPLPDTSSKVVEHSDPNIVNPLLAPALRRSLTDGFGPSPQYPPVRDAIDIPPP